MVFLTLENETGHGNVVVWKAVYERFRAAVVAGRLLRITGRVQRGGPVQHVIAERIEDVSAALGRLAGAGGAATPAPPARHPREQAKRLFPGRDFH